MKLKDLISKINNFNINKIFENRNYVNKIENLLQSVPYRTYFSLFIVDNFINLLNKYHNIKEKLKCNEEYINTSFYKNNNEKNDIFKKISNLKEELEKTRKEILFEWGNVKQEAINIIMKNIFMEEKIMR